MGTGERGSRAKRRWARSGGKCRERSCGWGEKILMPGLRCSGALFFAGGLFAAALALRPLAAAEEDPTAPVLPGEKKPAPVVVPADRNAPSADRPKIRKWLDEPGAPREVGGPGAVEVPVAAEDIELEEDAADRARRRAAMEGEIVIKLAKAKAALKRGDPQEAVNLARNVLTMDPRNILASEMLRKAQGKLLDADERVVGVAGDRRDRERMLEVDEHSVAPPPRLKEVRPHWERRGEDPETPRRKKIADKLEERVTVDFNKADLDFVLNTLFVLTGINIIADEAALEGKTVTMRVLDLPVREVLNFVVRNNDGIQFNITEDAVWVTASESSDLKKIMYPRIYPIHHGLVLTQENSGASTGQRSGGTGRAGGGRGGGGGGRGGGGGGGQRGGGGGGKQGQNNLEETYLETVLKWMKEAKDPSVFPDGSDYLIDRQSNQLIVFTTAAGHDRMMQFLDHFDQPAIQVLIKARFLDVSGLDNRELGINIDNIKTRLGVVDTTGNGTGTGTTGTGTTTGTTTTDTTGQITSGPNPFRSFSFTGATQAILGTGNVLTVTGRRTDPQFQVTLTALYETRATKVLSEPQILAINNKEAIIDITQHFSYITDLRPVTATTAVGNGVAVGSVPSFVPEFDEENIGFTLQVTPSVGRDLKTINLHLNPVIDELATGQSIQQFQNFDASIASANSSGVQPSIQRPTINQTSLETDVVLEDNGYVMIGGLMRNFKEVRERRIPGLSRIPYLGNLFKTHSTSIDRRNLMIIVEAQIVTAAGRTYYKDADPDDVDPREGGTNRAPGEISDAIRADAVNSAVGVAIRKNVEGDRLVTRNSDPKIDAPRRSRPAPVQPVSNTDAPETSKPAARPDNSNDAPAKTMSPRERMERLARSSRATTAQLTQEPGWAVSPEEEVPPASGRGEVLTPPNE